MYFNSFTWGKALWLVGVGTPTTEKKGKKHVVFRNSFDCKELTHLEMLQMKVDYMHKNPCQGKWNLAENYLKYPHSSAAFYELEVQNKWITNYAEIYC